MDELEFTEPLSLDEQAVLDNDQAAEAEPVAETPPESDVVSVSELETKVAETEDDKPPLQVPSGALVEEREKRQALEGQLGSAQENVRRLEGMFNQLTERMGQKPEAPAPDWDEDPDAYTRHILEKMETRLGSMETGARQQAQTQHQQAQEQQFIGAYQNAVAQFGKDDFTDAYSHVQGVIDEELTQRGFFDPVQRQQIALQEERAIVERAFAAGKNPAEVLYNYAGYRGYKPTVNGEDKLATIEKGQEASSTLPAGAGDTAPPVNVTRLLELEGEEFDKAFNDAQRKGLLG